MAAVKSATQASACRRTRQVIAVSDLADSPEDFARRFEEILRGSREHAR